MHTFIAEKIFNKCSAKFDKIPHKELESLRCIGGRVSRVFVDLMQTGKFCHGERMTGATITNLPCEGQRAVCRSKNGTGPKQE